MLEVETTASTPITCTATDFSGNTSTASATVTVPDDVGEKRKQN